MMRLAVAEAVAILEDGNRLTLRFDHEALIVAEETAGIPVKLLMQRLQGGFLSALRAVIYAMLREHHPDYDPKRVAVLVTHHAEQIMPAVGDVLARAFPDAAAAEAAETDGDAPLDAAENGGKGSSKRGAKRG